ncbi:hypothetical protein KFE25_006657 [Diacronema lutheri]|uniref:Hydroxyproline O-arabinosyltransferase-like domain-containing protein n=2 Tax=Diacronema lutheri TaxID=2081491 RepID=A0A8J5XY53_DIALT|nr:hypothetical protein KFE25_006657 [Diacronema lutheri]
MARLTPWRLACLGITFVLSVNVSSIVPYLIDRGRTAGAPATGASADAGAPGGRAARRAPDAVLALSVPAVAAAGVGGTAVFAGAGGECPGRKPYHTLLTATGQVYQQWQCRVMYRHWLKQRALDPKGACTEMTGFTRLVASAGARPDGIEDEVPSFFVHEYTNAELRQYNGYKVVNRPYSVVQLMAAPYWRERIPEEYVLIAETDHIFMQPIPNTAAPGAPSAYVFNYMGVNPAFEAIVHRHWRAGCGDSCTAPDYRTVQPIGPSPVLIHKPDLERVGAAWHKTAIALKLDPAADARLGWVIEMWGYAIASSAVGLRHTLFADFQVEPGALSSRAQLERFTERYWILHYTYQFEYYLDSTPCRPWMIGEYSLDKRHFSDAYPQRPLPLPPPKANVAAFWLVGAINEAMGNITDWPTAGGGGKPAGVRLSEQSVYGRRRAAWFLKHENGFKTEKRVMPLIAALIGTRWACTRADGGEAFELELGDGGDGRMSGRGGSVRWASMNNPELQPLCPIGACIYVDGGGGNANVHVAQPTGSGLTAYRDRPRGGPALWTCAIVAASKATAAA